MKRIICILIILLCLFINSSEAGTLKANYIQGKLISVFFGNDSGGITVRTPEGKEYSFRIVPCNDNLSKEEIEELMRLSESLKGKVVPSIADKNSIIRVWFLQGKEKTYIKHEILSSPPELWITIIGSKKDISDAQTLKHKAFEKGFFPGIINSSDFKLLRAGYFVVVLDCFDNKREAVSLVKRARKTGWKDAYAKRIK